MEEATVIALTCSAPRSFMTVTQQSLRRRQRGLMIRKTWSGVHPHNNYFLISFIHAKGFPMETVHTLFPLPGVTFSGFFHVWFFFLLSVEMSSPERCIFFTCPREAFLPCVVVSISGSRVPSFSGDIMKGHDFIYSIPFSPSSQFPVSQEPCSVTGIS